MSNQSTPSMSSGEVDLPQALVLDGNAAAGLLAEVFGVEMTASPAQCAYCGDVREFGTLLAFVGGPGTVLRCSVCKEVVVRIVRTPSATLVDVRGAAWIQVPATAATG